MLDVPVVRTTCGLVRGVAGGDGTSRFLAVPYAAGPQGRGRFGAPELHAPWAGVRDATRPGATAPQPVRRAFGVLDMSPYFGPGWLRGRDYLTADVWSPARGRQPAPVVVFVHGGGFLAGSTSAPLYDGSSFARSGVVLVTVNYRLGIHGFLHLPDAPDNRGLLDLLAALRWVRDNAAAFGGDPDRVTVCGQSAGAVLVSALLADPASEGLLNRAVLQSGTGTGAQTVEQAALVTHAVSDALGLEATASSLGALTDDRLVDVLPALAGLDVRTAAHRAPLGTITPFSVVLDEQPVVAIAAGRSAGVDVLAGTTRDEGALYLAPLGLLPDSTAADVRGVAAQFCDRPDELVTAYRTASPGACAAKLRTQILGDGLFRTGTRRLLAAHAGAPAAAGTYGFEFSWRSDALEGQLGACHTIELPFVFDRTGLSALRGPAALLGSTAPPPDLAAVVQRTWLRFAQTGDPGEPSSADFRLFRVPAQPSPSGPVEAAWDAQSLPPG